MSISDILDDVKTAVSVAIATCGSGVATFLEMIPTDIGKVATLMGVVLSIVLIYTHLKKSRLMEEKHKLEMELLHKQIKDRKEQGNGTKRV